MRDTRTFARAAVTALALVLLAACSDDSPTEPTMQVIEELDFAESLNIDLSTMKRLGNGSYTKDLVEGDGATIEYGSDIDLSYTGWLADGTKVVESRFQFTLGLGTIPVGLQQGMLNQRDGGVRLMIIPPQHMYGGIDYVGTEGVLIPGGSVLVFEVTVHSVV